MLDNDSWSLHRVYHKLSFILSLQQKEENLPMLKQ